MIATEEDKNLLKVLFLSSYLVFHSPFVYTLSPFTEFHCIKLNFFIKSICI